MSGCNEVEQRLEQLNFIVDNINQPVFAIDDQCNIIILNKSAEKSLKIKYDEVMGQNIYNLFPDSLPEHRVLPRALKGEVLKDFVFDHKKPINMLIKANAMPIEDSKGHIIGAVNYFEDITELTLLKEKSDALDQLLEQQHFVLDSMQNQVIIIDKDAKIKVWNKAMVNTTGIKLKDAIGHDLKDLKDKCKCDKTPVLKSLATGKDLKNRKMKIWGNNKYYEMVVNTKVIRNAENELLGVMAIYTDVTELNRQARILEQNERLASVSQLAAGLAHEIRNPLTSVKGFIQLLQSQHTEHHKYYDIIIDELDQTNKLISDFLLLAKPAETCKEIFDLNLLVKETFNLINPQAILQEIEIQEFTAEQPLYIEGDPYQIKQVIINLIKNAIESIADKGVITLNTQSTGEKVIFSVEDNGSGISNNDMAKIFDVLYSTKEMGTGLGLSLSKQIIDRHNGFIDVFSTPGHGSIFKVYLPLAV